MLCELKQVFVQLGEGVIIFWQFGKKIIFTEYTSRPKSPVRSLILIGPYRSFVNPSIFNQCV